MGYYEVLHFEKRVVVLCGISCIMNICIFLVLSLYIGENVICISRFERVANMALDPLHL